MKKTVVILFLLVGMIFGLLCTSAGAYTPVKVEKNVFYGTGPRGKNPAQMLDIYRPETGKNLPVLLFIHGGGWRKGSKDRMARVGKMLAAKNIVAVMINYRLSPAHKHPAHVDDAARAFAWTVKNIRKYGGDPDMVFVGGHSAGGHTAALLTCDPQYLKKVGLTPKNIYGTVLISGLYYLEPGPDPWNPDENGRVYKNMIVPAFGTISEEQRDASPVGHLRADLPPVLILYAQMESELLKSQARAFYRAMSDKGAPAQLMMLMGRNHLTEISKFGAPKDPTLEKINHFIKFRSYD